ncbi:hypothetical protein GCM10010156_59730 [Planobispora rosea]|uniref:YcaO domain-containing protein n=1 Tax=Planobispora rosea TaxID=35762 RepID=A0A8J3WFD3_PLARO|nr:hypothetical protein GCM10010156_59730 [Planobispora rosea]GIH87275.1 hypothetical protein Pro02_56830 [Planobispora rosea]
MISEEQSHVVEGESAVRILPLLDGGHSVEEIAAVTGLPFTQVLFAVHRYAALGHLADGSPDLPGPELAYWDYTGADPAGVDRLMAEHPIAVVTLGDADATAVLAALRDNGLRARPSDPAKQLSIAPDAPGSTLVVTDDYLNPALRDLNAAFLRAGRSWLPVKPRGLSLWFGPIFTPGRTGCWECLAQRVESNRQVESYLQRKRGDDPVRTSLAGLPSGARTVAGLLAEELARSVVTGSSELADGRLVTLDTRSFEIATHELVRRPQCPACGDPSITADRDPRVELVSRRVNFRQDGGYRVLTPKETFDRLERHISPFLGAITRLGSLSGDDNGITRSYSAGHNFAVTRDNLAMLKRNLRGQSGGKGRTDIQAKTSAVCEAIERYSGVWRGDEPVVHASFDELADSAIAPNDLMLFSERQFATRLEWNARPDTRLHKVPRPLRPDQPLDWSPLWSLTEQRVRHVPASYAWYGHPDVEDSYVCYSDANGCASGNTVEEAVLQGLCELIERDSVALWWYNRVRRPAVDLDSVRDPYIDLLREFYAAASRSLWVLDITSDLGVPAYVCVSHRTDHPVQDIVLGFGAHLDSRLALIRAITEVNQFLPAIEQRDADGGTIYLEDDPGTLEWWREATVEAEPWLVPDPAATARTLPALDAGDDLKVMVEGCVTRLAAHGLETLVLDQSKPDLDLNVVKVVVPGMRHFWRRLGPGRLYDVPVELGWLDQPTTEDGFNPRSVFF